MTRLIATRCQLENTDKNANEIIHNPFESKAQQRWMFWKYPKMAKRWAKETPNIKKLPEYKHKK